MNRYDISELYECIINDNFKRFPNLEKYRYFFELFFNNYNRDYRSLDELVKILDLYYKDINKLSREFVEDIKVQDQLQLGYATSAPIYALGLLFDKDRYPFNYDYYKWFKILFVATGSYKKKYKEVNKYRDIYDQVIDFSSLECCKAINQDNYRNFQFNYHMLTNYALAYSYFKSYEPERIKEIVEYFVKNYEQLINNFEVNGLTREELVISKQGLDYYMEYYNNINKHKELKSIR